MGHLLHQPHPWCVGRTGRSVCIVNGAENGFQMGFVLGAGELVEKFKACTRMHFWLSVRFCTAEQNEIHEMDLFAPCVCFEVAVWVKLHTIIIITIIGIIRLRFTPFGWETLA